MFMINHTEISWQYWLVTAILLTAGIFGYPVGFELAIGLSLFQLVHFAIREGGVTAFPVQVRFFYLLLLIILFPEPMRILYWVPFLGTWAQVIFGYCLMARMVSLLPWNRREPYSLDSVMKTFLSRPVRGNILQGQPPQR